MGKAVVLSIILIAVVTIIGVLVVIPRVASAQAPPQPPPDTTGSCCRVLATSSRTIGGPGAVKLAPPTADIIFESRSRIGICATVENTGVRQVRLIVLERLVRVPGGFSAGTGDTTQAEIEPGQTSTVCRQDATGAVISKDGPSASYLWRIDRAD